MKIKLDKWKTAILLTTKDHKLKEDIDFVKTFSGDSTESILNQYPEIVKLFYIRGGFSEDFPVKLNHIVHLLLDVAELVLEKREFICIIKSMYDYTGTNNTRQLIFKELYGELQALQMVRRSDIDGEEVYVDIFDLDESLLMENN